ncbi:MAG: hypothetical protein HKM95_01935 [Inquilinus sp.]|nr:hypothetical protein [Inquilinus sp.]
MVDWNVVVTVREDAFTRVFRLFSEFGKVRRAGYYNVFVLKVEDRRRFLDSLSGLLATDPDLLKAVSRVMPAEIVFTFQDRESFEAQARAAALEWLPRLAGMSLHVRMHRRGFHEQISSPDEERFLAEAILERLEDRGTPGRITFEDPDAILDVDTVDNRAGLALWTREELSRYPFLNLD